jgi:hypothetical protein
MERLLNRISWWEIDGDNDNAFINIRPCRYTKKRAAAPQGGLPTGDETGAQGMSRWKTPIEAFY